MMGIKFTKEDIVVGVDKLPNRKSKCLYLMQDNTLEVLAYFQNEVKAGKFDLILDRFLEVLSDQNKKIFALKNHVARAINLLDSMRLAEKHLYFVDGIDLEDWEKELRKEYPELEEGKP